MCFSSSGLGARLQGCSSVSSAVIPHVPPWSAQDRRCRKPRKEHASGIPPSSVTGHIGTCCAHDTVPTRLGQKISFWIINGSVSASILPSVLPVANVMVPNSSIALPQSSAAVLVARTYRLSLPPHVLCTECAWACHWGWDTIGCMTSVRFGKSLAGLMSRS